MGAFIDWSPQIPLSYNADTRFDDCYAFHVQLFRREPLPRLEVPTEHVCLEVTDTYSLTHMNDTSLGLLRLCHELSDLPKLVIFFLCINTHYIVLYWCSVSQHLTTQAWDLRQIWWFQRVKWQQRYVFALARIRNDSGQIHCLAFGASG